MSGVFLPTGPFAERQREGEAGFLLDEQRDFIPPQLHFVAPDLQQKSIMLIAIKHIWARKIPVD